MESGYLEILVQKSQKNDLELILIFSFLAIPLSQFHPNEQIEYFLNDSSSEVIIASSEFESKLKPVAEKLKKPLIIVDHCAQAANDNETGVGEIQKFISEVPCRSEDSAMIM